MSKYKNKDGIELSYTGNDVHQKLVREVAGEAVRLCSEYNWHDEISMRFTLSNVRRGDSKSKGWFEEWLDISFVEKLITLAWCGLPYIIWLMVDGLAVGYKVLASIGIWIFLTLLCYWFGKFMSNDERNWN